MRLKILPLPFPSVSTPLNHILQGKWYYKPSYNSFQVHQLDERLVYTVFAPFYQFTKFTRKKIDQWKDYFTDAILHIVTISRKVIPL